jgi:hypothetical protein
MVETYERMYEEKPKFYSSPLEKGDHPELDESPLCEPPQVTEYMSIMGLLQWLISLGRFDVSSAMTGLSTFCPMPKIGHLNRAKRVVGYVAKFKDGNNHEEFPNNMPTPLGKLVRTTKHADAKLYFDLITGRACTGILIFLNPTPIDWYCKRQSTVACATFGYEFVAAKTTTEKDYNLRYTLTMMGNPVDYQTYLFGDNAAVITQSTIPHSQLGKRHNALAYHFTRKAIATGMIHMFHVAGFDNPADYMKKFLGYQEWIRILRPVLFWQGDTATIPTKGE